MRYRLSSVERALHSPIWESHLKSANKKCGMERTTEEAVKNLLDTAILSRVWFVIVLIYIIQIVAGIDRKIFQ
jgi:hypothetical protein